MTISEFLLARISEDEEQAEVCKVMRWTPAKKYGITVTHPARVLAECAAKREIVERHSSCDDVSYGDASTCPEMRILAAVYADHPDYQPEWAVQA